MKPNTINLHIDKIVLEGVGQYDQNQISLVMQRELQRLIANQGLHRSLHQPTSLKRVQAKPISVGSQVNTRQLGNQLANSIYRGLKR